MNPAFHDELCGPMPGQTAARPTPSFSQLTVEIHASNVTAGWWTDIKTGESILSTRNRPEMLMLAVSELAEAAAGAFGGDDDKLPHLPMFDVELADFAIRQFDQIGAEVSLGYEMPDWAKLASWHHPGTIRGSSRIDQLMLLVQVVSEAMEFCRKGRGPQYVRTMARGVRLAFFIAEVNGIDLFDMIEQKRAFNASRADHKVENRLQDGGKQF